MGILLLLAHWKKKSWEHFDQKNTNFEKSTDFFSKYSHNFSQCKQTTLSQNPGYWFTKCSGIYTQESRFTFHLSTFYRKVSLWLDVSTRILECQLFPPEQDLLSCTGKNHRQISGQNLYFPQNVLKKSIFCLTGGIFPWIRSKIFNAVSTMWNLPSKNNIFRGLLLGFWGGSYEWLMYKI